MIFPQWQSLFSVWGSRNLTNASVDPLEGGLGPPCSWTAFPGLAPSDAWTLSQRRQLRGRPSDGSPAGDPVPRGGQDGGRGHAAVMGSAVRPLRLVPRSKAPPSPPWARPGPPTLPPRPARTVRGSPRAGCRPSFSRLLKSLKSPPGQIRAEWSEAMTGVYQLPYGRGAERGCGEAWTAPSSGALSVPRVCSRAPRNAP